MDKSKKEFKILYKASFKSKSENEIMIWLAEPADSNYQKIENYSINLNQDSEYRVNENHIHFFRLSDRNIELNVGIKAVLSKEIISAEKLVFGKLPKEISTQYLSSEKYLEQTREIIDLTKKIIRDKKAPLEKIRAIFKYVIENFKYCYPVKKRGVENLDLKNLSGDCAEYSSLFVTMCRIAGIATRNVTGYVIFENKNQISEHGWAQVYTDRGWLDADPQYASLEKNVETGTEKYLFNRTEYRIIFTNGFNISLKPSIPAGFDKSNMAKLGLPIDRKNVQVLQPLVFASKKPVNFENMIVLK